MHTRFVTFHCLTPFVGLLYLSMCPQSSQPIDWCPAACECYNINFETVVECSKSFQGFPDMTLAVRRQIAVLRLKPGINEESNLGFIDKDTFNEFTNIHELRLENLKLKNIHLASFRKLNLLSKLSLATNEIDDLPPSIFAGLYNLVLVDLSNNRIKVLTGNMFMLPKLTLLSLKNNAIQMLPVGIFKHSSRLQILDISGNKLEHLQAELFQGLPLLRILKMNNCSFTTFPKYFMYYLENVTIIELKDNMLSTFDVTLFNTTKKLAELHLDGNRIISLQPGFLRDLKLRTLSISRNKIISIGIGAFRQFTAEIINLKDNYFQYIPPAIFSHMNDTLRLLYLSGNPLKRIHDNTFFGLPNLRTLDLSRTHLKEISRDMLRGLNLQFLNLSMNDVTVLGNNSLSGLDTAELVQLKGERWECGCRIRPLQQWLISKGYGKECLDSGGKIHPTLPFIEMRPGFNCLVCGENSVFENKGKSVINLTQIETEKCYVPPTSAPTIGTPTFASQLTSLDIGLLSLACFILLIIIALIIFLCISRHRTKQQEYSFEKNSFNNYNNSYSNFPGYPDDGKGVAWSSPELWSVKYIECVDAAKPLERKYFPNSFHARRSSKQFMESTV